MNNNKQRTTKQGINTIMIRRQTLNNAIEHQEEKKYTCKIKKMKFQIQEERLQHQSADKKYNTGCIQNCIRSQEKQDCGSRINRQVYKQWDQSELEILCSLYIQCGPSWQIISTYLDKRNQASVKNKFNNSLRQLNKSLKLIQGEYYKATRASISKQVLLSILDFVNSMDKSIKLYNLTPHGQNNFSRLRSLILFYGIIKKQYQKQQLLNLLKMVRLINSKIRSFGIYRTKNRKNRNNWQLSKNGLLRIRKYQKIFEQQQIITQVNQKIKDSQIYLQNYSQDDSSYRIGTIDLSNLRSLSVFSHPFNITDSNNISNEDPLYFDSQVINNNQSDQIPKSPTLEHLDQEIQKIFGRII